MYKTFFNLTAPPFENTPDPRFFYQSEQHREALASIEYMIRLRKGYVVITGEIGSGKTTIGRTMCERCGKTATIVHVTHSHRDGESLLRQVIRGLGGKYGRHDDHGRLLERLGGYLFELARQQRPVVLFVDEAQTMADQALEELRLMSSFDTPTQKLIQIVIVGQPELRERLQHPSLAPLRQRIVLAKHLLPLDLNETASYILHRLKVAAAEAGRPGVAFNHQAIFRIYQVSGGIPRLINNVCDNALLLAYVKQQRVIDGAMIDRVAMDMISDVGEQAISVPGMPGAAAAPLRFTARAA